MTIPRFEYMDGDGPFIEYQGCAVRSIMWHTGGVMLDFPDGTSENVYEDTKVECGMAITACNELNLIFGEWVSAREARFGRA